MTHKTSDPPELRFAAEVLSGEHWTPTPLLPATVIGSRLGCDLWLKREDCTPIGSVKLRGALVAMARLGDDLPPRCVYVASAGNYGLAIILLTALLRLVFWPLNQKSMTSMRKTQKLQPQMAAIRGKYKGTKDVEKRQKMNEEVMALYKREGVSPLGGCLPMVAQIPILFSFYALLSVAIELRQAPFFFWVTDLSRHDPYLVLPLLMGGSMLAQQRLTPQASADPQQASMMKMMRLMPIFFTVMFLYVPSGLVLYWLTNNLLGISQQLFVNRSMDRQLEAEKAAKKTAKKSGKSQRGK